MNLISLYQATATATGGRADGTVRTVDGAIVMRLGLPKELGGGGDAGEHLINPEQFFACAWAASFADSLGLVARQRNRVLREISVTARINFGQYEADGFGIEAEFEISLPELSAAEAEEIIAAARQTYPYSKRFAGAENARINLKT